MTELTPIVMKPIPVPIPDHFRTLSLSDWVDDIEEADSSDLGAISKIASDICSAPTALLGVFDGHRIEFSSYYRANYNDTQHAKNIFRSVQRQNCIVEYLFRDDQQRFVLCVGVPVKGIGGKLLGAICVINYGELELAENERTALESLAHLAATVIELKTAASHESTQLKFLEENTSVEMYLVSPDDFSVTFANTNALLSLGCDLGSVVEKKVTDILIAKDTGSFEQQLKDLSAGTITSFSTMVEQKNRDESKTPVKLFVSLTREGFESSILIVAKNLSKAGFTSDFVDYLNNYDSITGLGNRRLFETLVSEEIHTSVNSPVESALLLVNLDNFKLLNQSFGYQIGDKLARQVSKLLAEDLGSDELLVRTAEDDYCVILPQQSEDQIRYRSQKLIEKISGEDFSENGKKFKLQVNVGAVLLNCETCRSIDYLSVAHKACEIAKERGQNQYYLADQNDELFIRKRVEMEQLVSIQDAIERNKLVLFAQKIDRVSPHAGDFAEHCEILIRMKGDNDEVISPAAFIPQLETHGSIVSLDRWVLTESLKLVEKRYSELPANPPNVRLLYNINLSFRSIADACFVSYCMDKLTEYAHVAPFICFEITETVAISNFAKVKEFIEQINQFGCKFALDDFGSGGASLQHLKELSMDYLKIDGSFVQDIVDNPISQIIVESICKVSRVLNVRVIAEKVENQMVEDKLREYGVHYIQGFKFHKPMPFAELPQPRSGSLPFSRLRATFTTGPAFLPSRVLRSA